MNTPPRKETHIVAVIDPCHKCGRPVSHDGTEYPHNILCAEHRTENLYAEKLARRKALLEHALTTCDDPDCEIHNPWMQEDEAEATIALAWFVAGAQGYAKYLDGTLKEYLRDIADELSAPAHPGGE
jgi:hypothetical protein